MSVFWFFSASVTEKQSSEESVCLKGQFVDRHFKAVQLTGVNNIINI